MTLVRTRQHWFPRTLNIAFTLMVWAGFAYLMVDGVSTLLIGNSHPREIQLPGQFFATVNSLLWYLAMATVLSALLLTWAKRSEHKASRYRRRTRIPDIPAQQLANSLGVSLEILAMAHREQVLVLHNDANGQLQELTFIRQGYQRLNARSRKVPMAEVERLVG